MKSYSAKSHTNPKNRVLYNLGYTMLVGYVYIRWKEQYLWLVNTYKIDI